MPYAFIQASHNSDNASGTTLVATFGAPVTAGNGLALICGYQGGDAEIAIADGANTWVEDVSLFVPGSGLVGRLRVFTKMAAAGGFTTVTMTPDAAVTSRHLFVVEYSGLSAYLGGVYAETDAPGNTNADAISSGNFNFASQPALSLGWGIDGAADSGPPTAGTGYTSRAMGLTFGGAVNAARFADKRITATGNNAATFTPLAGSHPYAAFQLAFSESVAGGSLPPPRRPNMGLMLQL